MPDDENGINMQIREEPLGALGLNVLVQMP